MSDEPNKEEELPAPVSDEERNNRTFTQMFEAYFGPEIERRQRKGILSGDFALYMGQVLFPIEGKAIVHLNEEAKGVALMRANRPVQAGDKVTTEDLGRIERFDLPDDLLDNGHFTIIRTADRWHMFFNFLSGRRKAQDRLRLALEFLEAARDATLKGHAGPSIDNLFSAAELTAKAELMLHRSEASRAKSHKPIASAINMWSKLGNIERPFVELFNRLAEQRPNARYADSAHRPQGPTSDELELVGAVIERLMRRAANRAGEE